MPFNVHNRYAAEYPIFFLRSSPLVGLGLLLIHEDICGF